MENSMGNEGINKLAAVFQDRMRQMGERPQTLDFGVIQGDMSLLLNGFPKPIPPQDYLVCRQLTLGAAGEEYCETTSDGHHAHNYSGKNAKHKTRRQGVGGMGGRGRRLCY